MMNRLAESEAEVKICTQEMASVHRDIAREFSDPALASKSKVKLEA